MRHGGLELRLRPVTPRIRATWTRRAAAEYRSAAITTHLLHWFLQIGLAPRLLARVHGVVADELEHADLSRSILHAAGGEGVGVVRDTLSVGAAPDEGIERRALLGALSELALHESVALEVFRAQLAAPLVPLVRAATERIVRDEARHRRLGWEVVRALLDGGGDRDWLRGWVPRALAELEAGYTGGQEVDEVERAWGLLGAAARTAAVARALRGPVAVHLARLGLTVK